MKYSVHEATRIGGRSSNQDRSGFAYTTDTALLILADGMGGHMAGDMAAEILVATVKDVFRKRVVRGHWHVPEFLIDALFTAHETVNAYAERHALPEIPRTTAVVCVVKRGRAIWAHVGDSRLYHFSREKCLFHTRDHSVVQQLVDEGRIDEDAVAAHPERNKLYNSIGGLVLPNIELSQAVALNEGDVLMLCSDGVWGELSAHEMFVALRAYPLARAAAHMLDFAELRGGQNADNATLIALRFGEERFEPGRLDMDTAGPLDGPATLLGHPLAENGDPGDLDALLAEIHAALEKHRRDSG